MPQYTIPNLKNACRLLRLVGEAPAGSNLASLASSLELPKTTALRIVSTLTAEGFLVKRGRLFFLGPALLALGMKSEGLANLKEIAKPLLTELTAATEETSHLAVWDDGRALISEVCVCPHPLSAASSVGTRAYAHCSATGKVLLAHNFADQIESVWPEGERVQQTRKTLLTVADLETNLARVKRVGYALDDEEYFDGVRCIAVPVHNAVGEVVAAIGITASASRFTRKRIPEFAEVLKETATRASRQLGYGSGQTEDFSYV